MKPDLAKQLLKSIIEPAYNDEAKAEKIVKDLQFLAEYKYDHYEMYAPGRHFLENLYIWLNQFDQSHQKVALDYVLKDLIFISRNEFELLARVLYWDIVKIIQYDIASKDSGIPRHKVYQISISEELKRIERSTLYIAMSDGARIDYFRRQHCEIGNEQVLTSYHVDHDKCKEMIDKLDHDCGTKGSKFRLLFLIDDFCASGSTLIREKDGALKGTLRKLEQKTFFYNSSTNGKTEIISSTLLDYLLDKSFSSYLCPLLATQKSVENISYLLPRLTSSLKSLTVKPVAIINESLRLRDTESEVGKLCSHYYQKRMGDEHTGDVTYGYNNCGLPVVLHHNTPNNSLYILWNRRADVFTEGQPVFEPLFKRIERHKSNRD